MCDKPTLIERLKVLKIARQEIANELALIENDISMDEKELKRVRKECAKRQLEEDRKAEFKAHALMAYYDQEIFKLGKELDQHESKEKSDEIISKIEILKQKRDSVEIKKVKIDDSERKRAKKKLRMDKKKLADKWVEYSRIMTEISDIEDILENL